MFERSGSVFAPDGRMSSVDTSSPSFSRTVPSTVSGSGATFTIDNDVVTNAKAANMADSTVKGRAVGAGTGDPTDLTANQTSTLLDTATDPFLRTSAASSVARVGVIQLTIGNGVDVIGTGVKGFISIPVACTLTGWRLLSTDAAATSGAIKIDVWRDTYTNYPPDNSDSITNAHEPEIVATNKKAEDTNISDWTSVAIVAGDVIGFNVDSCTSITRATLHIQLTVP